MIFRVKYPGGEEVYAVGYPGQKLVVDIVPGGPESCFLDEIEVDFASPSPHPVRRILGGPRRPTIHMRLIATEAEREIWMDAREKEGWSTNDRDAAQSIIWCVAEREGLDVAALERDGATVVRQ